MGTSQMVVLLLIITPDGSTSLVFYMDGLGHPNKWNIRELWGSHKNIMGCIDGWGKCTSYMHLDIKLTWHCGVQPTIQIHPTSANCTVISPHNVALVGADGRTDGRTYRRTTPDATHTISSSVLQTRWAKNAWKSVSFQICADVL